MTLATVKNLRRLSLLDFDFFIWSCGITVACSPSQEESDVASGSDHKTKTHLPAPAGVAVPGLITIIALMGGAAVL